MHQHRTNAGWVHRWESVMQLNYRTPALALVSGSGCEVTDADGNTYLDLIAGIAVSALGHAHPAIVEAVSRQVSQIAHTSNLAINEPAVELSERLAGMTGDPSARVFLCNDGATANEAALKIVRRARPDRRRIVAAERSFHGRTLGALSVTGKAAIREPFVRDVLDVTFVPYADPDALAEAVDPSVAAVILEPTLGEAGVIPPAEGYLKAARGICDESDTLLIIDEVQGGIGRTGRWFAHQHEDIRPDIITLAKGLGGGLPIGACIATGDCATALRPGDHGSTFGGNPVSAAAANAVIQTIETEALLSHVEAVGDQWLDELSSIEHQLIDEVRGRGLWLAIGMSHEFATQVEATARGDGFLVNAVAPDAIRLAPPLILSSKQARRFTDALPMILDAVTTAKVTL